MGPGTRGQRSEGGGRRGKGDFKGTLNIQHRTCFVETIVRLRRQPFPRPASGARGEGIFKKRLLSPALSSVGDGGEGDQPPVFSRLQDLFYKAHRTSNIHPSGLRPRAADNSCPFVQFASRFCAFCALLRQKKSAFICVYLRLNALHSLRLKRVREFGVVCGSLRFAGLARLREPDDGTSGNKNDLTVLLFQFHVS